MRNIYLFVFLILFQLLNSCKFHPSDGAIDNLIKPNLDLYGQFNYKPQGQIIYQSYHEYGFTDLVWQLITIIKHDTIIEFENQLPIDTNTMKQVDFINYDKFVAGFPIQFPNDYRINEDVTVKAMEYHDTIFKLNVNHDLGTYSAYKDSDVYCLRVFDIKNKLEYIELKKK